MLPVIFNGAANELVEISEAGAKSLSTAGQDLQPVKADMLRLPPGEAALVVTACNMLFAALLEYEQGMWDADHARTALQLVNGRMKAGRANAVVESLFFGPTARLLWIACDRAPIAYSGLAAASPAQNIIDRTYKNQTPHQ